MIALYPWTSSNRFIYYYPPHTCTHQRLNSSTEHTTLIHTTRHHRWSTYNSCTMYNICFKWFCLFFVFCIKPYFLTLVRHPNIVIIWPTHAHVLVTTSSPGDTLYYIILVPIGMVDDVLILCVTYARKAVIVKNKIWFRKRFIQLTVIILQCQIKIFRIDFIKWFIESHLLNLMPFWLPLFKIVVTKSVITCIMYLSSNLQSEFSVVLNLSIFVSWEDILHEVGYFVQPMFPIITFAWFGTGCPTPCTQLEAGGVGGDKTHHGSCMKTSYT